jgi:NTE family protein
LKPRIYRAITWPAPAPRKESFVTPTDDGHPLDVEDRILLAQGPIAYVLGGGGLLGAAEVGMLQALTDRGLRPDLVLGSSVGALNGAVIAADPAPDSVARLIELWTALGSNDVFASSLFGQMRTLARSRTHLHSNVKLRALIEASSPGQRIEDLQIPFQCVAVSIETARARWFDSGPVSDAVLASCAVPGLLPPVPIDGEHYLDGGLVDSLPLGRAIALGARTVYVLHVGRIERPLSVPRWPWEVGLVAFEVARRHRFIDDLENVPSGVRVHVLPAGDEGTPLANLRYRDSRSVGTRIERAHRATAAYLHAHQLGETPPGEPAR